jgi:hypothetical protein
MPTDAPKRFLSIRLTDEELQQVYRQCEISHCRNLTEYAKKVLVPPPVAVNTRSASRDELLRVMAGIRERIDWLAGKAREKKDADLLRAIGEIKVFISKNLPSDARFPDHINDRP